MGVGSGPLERIGIQAAYIVAAPNRLGLAMQSLPQEELGWRQALQQPSHNRDEPYEVPRDSYQCEYATQYAPVAFAALRL